VLKLIISFIEFIGPSMKDNISKLGHYFEKFKAGERRKREN
jgi:hypothetical protein